MKAKRQQEILQVIAECAVETQEQLLAELSKRGVTSTQATISRDIKDLHLIKELGSSGVYQYVVSDRRPALDVAGRLRTIFKESVTSFDVAQNIIVIKTMPGLGSAACAAMDTMDISGLVGTIAGDDTGLMIMSTNEDAVTFCDEIHKMLK